MNKEEYVKDRLSSVEYLLSTFEEKVEYFKKEIIRIKNLSDEEFEKNIKPGLDEAELKTKLEDEKLTKILKEKGLTLEQFDNMSTDELAEMFKDK